MSTHGPDTSSPTKTPRRIRLRSLVVGAVLGLIVTLVVVLVTMLITNERLPRLTQADYEAAVARWEKNGPADYDLDLQLQGNRPGSIHVEVRGGEAVHMVRDSVEPAQKRTWDYWTVLGQLDTIGQELEMAKDPARSFNVPGATQVVLWAEFDPQYGYPRRYRRVVLGADFEVDWIVTEFSVVPSK